MKVLIPDTIALNPLLPADAIAVPYEADADIPEEHRDAEVLVAWGNPHGQLNRYAEQLQQLRLVQGLMAGPDSLLKAGFGADVVLCSGVGLHDKTVTEHALALTLSLVRELPQAAAFQARREWSAEIGGVRPLHGPGPVTTLIDARVLIWGFGSIAQNLAPLLTSLGASVRGVARHAGVRSGYEVIADTDLAGQLGQVDVLIMLLPSLPSTTHVLDADVLAALPDTAFVVNCGRGSTVDEAALDAALRGGDIAGAAIDVAETEPLPATSPLWDAPHLLITPHAAGGRPVGADDLVAANVEALVAGRPLRNHIAR